jgi:glycosyltransferase involved in cell wall biosynthesis
MRAVANKFATARNCFMAKLSLIIPSRNEKFLVPTVESVLRNAVDEIEVIVILDGYWPIPPLPDDPRIVVLHRGTAQGMRPGINAAVMMATGEWLMKLDAHCDVSLAFDTFLKTESDKDWVVVPRRMSLDPFKWAREDNGRSPVDAHYLSYPFERENDSSCGMHGTVWNARARARKDVLIDDEMSSQGSCWFMHRNHWNRIGRMEPEKYGNFIQEFQEIGLKTWLGGGQVKVNKNCHYLHLHKGKIHGRMYFISKQEMQAGADFATHYWMTDSWEKRVHNLKWLIERFSPVPGWPEDLDMAFAKAHRKFGTVTV